MNMQPEDNLENFFRDKLTNFKDTPSDFMDNKILDSIIDHSAKPSFWNNYGDSILKGSAGIILGAIITSVYFILGRESTDVITESETQYEYNEALTATVNKTEGQKLYNAPLEDFTLSETREANSPAQTNVRTRNEQNNSRKALIDSKKNIRDPKHASNSSNDIRISTNKKAFSNNKGTEGSPNRDAQLTIGQNSGLGGKSPILPQENNAPYILGRSFNAPFESVDNPANTICYSNIGFPQFETIEKSEMEYTLPSGSNKATMSDMFRHHGVEIYTGFSKYSQKSTDGKTIEVDMQSLSVNYFAQFSDIELKTGVQFVQFNEPHTYNYTYLKTDTTGKFLIVDSLTQTGEIIGSYIYDTVSNEYSSQAQSEHTKRWIGIPILIGYKFERGRINAGIYAGVACYYNINTKVNTPDFNGVRLVSFTENNSGSSTSFNTAVLGQMQIGYRINSHIEAVANGEYKQFTRNFLPSEYSSKYSPSIGANIGIRVFF